MGKSNKKVKNDRINAIKKQYDAFLEEDKKRRERNEYILYQLDKMRSSSALVPIPNKANFYNTEANPYEIFMRPINLRSKAEKQDTLLSSHLDKQSVTSGIINKPIDEMRILKEISKKYILIPKRTTPIEKDYSHNNDMIDDDWKSKYSILEDLKKLDKEGQSGLVNAHYNDDNNMHNKKAHLSTESDYFNKVHPNLGHIPDNFDIRISEKTNELRTMNKANHDSSGDENKVSNQVNFNVPKITSQDTKKSEITSQSAALSLNRDIKFDPQSVYNAVQERIINPQEDVAEKEKFNSEVKEKDLNESEILSNNLYNCEMSNVKNSTVHQISVDSSDNNTPVVETNKYTASENIISDVAHASVPDQTISDVKPQDINASDETVQLDGNSDTQKDIREIQDLTASQRVDVYDDVDNNPEGLIAASENDFDKPQHDNPTQNTVPVDLENIQHPEHVEHESEINAFEAEQKEMFYSEQSNIDAYAYNEGENNAGEYTGGYEQNDQYAYYEGVQQEQAYATNIDEHEEATERYDPHYNQQYEGPYENQQSDNIVGYEDPNAARIYEQQQFQSENQQLENTSSYENQQENVHLYEQENVNNTNEVQENVLPQDEQLYDQHLYAENSGTQEHIEQQLITEEGYIENNPVITDEYQKETESEVETVINTTSEEPALDPSVIK